MPITFRHIERDGNFIFTSLDLPGWKCSAPTRAMADQRIAGSLRSYLRNERGIPAEIRDELTAMVGLTAITLRAAAVPIPVHLAEMPPPPHSLQTLSETPADRSAR